MATVQGAPAKPINGVQTLTAAGAASAERRLAEILAACVEGGASVSFLPPLPLDAARAYMRDAAQGAAAGRCILLAAWTGGVLSGTVRVQLDTPQNQRHRAEICKMLVHPDARRGGLGRDLLLAAEAAAAGAGRARRIACQRARLCCGSMSSTATCRTAASAAARLATSVDLPAPPFCCATVITIDMPGVPIFR